MYYFKNIFCLLALCITVNAQDWPVGRVSDSKLDDRCLGKCVQPLKYDLDCKY